MPRAPWRSVQRLDDVESLPWVALLVAARLLATAIAVGLILTSHVDVGLLALAAYGVVSAVLIARAPGLRASPSAWLADSLIVLGCVLASGDWRSPFYLLWLTTLALPSVHLTLRRAAWLAIAAPIVYLVAGLVGGPNPGTLKPLTAETLVIHLALPALVVGGLAYAASVLRHLRSERTRRERLAIEAERRRIAWELHDSAKQRLHAAHLLVSSLQQRVPAELEPVVQRASIELESASADMDHSLAELRSPLEGRPLHDALAARASELSTADGPRITVRGQAPRLSPLVAAHAYRIGCEALTNALRHAEASAIDVTLEQTPIGLRIAVADDGRGFTDEPRPHGTGILAMQSRAASIGARLTVAPRGEQPGTQVVVELADAGPPPGRLG